MDESEIERQKNLAENNIYTRAFVSKLAAQFDISDKQNIEALKNCLCYSASIYRIQKKDEEHQIKSSNVRAELKEIEMRASALTNAFDSVSEETHNLYWGPLQLLPLEYYLSPDPLHLLGHPITRHAFDAKRISIDFPNEYKIRNSITLATNLASHALGRVKPDKGGRPSSQALWMWVANMYHFWKTHLGRRFTYLAHKNEPVSPAFRFCCRAFEPLDSSISATLIGTTMREVIRDKGVLGSSRKTQKGRKNTR